MEIKMKEGTIMVITGAAAGIEFLLIQAHPFAIIPMAVTVFLGMFAIHRKQKGRLTKAKIQKMAEGWKEQ